MHLVSSCCSRVCKIPLMSTNWIPSVTRSPPLALSVSLFSPPPLTSFTIFSVRSNTLLLLPSLAVPLTYLVAHRQRQEECLLLCAVSRSVGQRRDVCVRAFFPPAFVFALPLSSLLMKIIQDRGGRRLSAYIFPHRFVWFSSDLFVLHAKVRQDTRFKKANKQLCIQSRF